MVVKKLSHYLVTYRKRSRLTQDELGFLMGFETGNVVGNFEQGRRVPAFQNVVAFELVFGCSAKELFAGVYEELFLSATKRAKKLIDRLNREEPTPVTARKIEFLKEFLRRAKPIL
jgi:transcriptional regulator with XRE-family HTH domain